eukprot:TRINITY_DN949_c0_g2_i2.p1 TRINITY_DN949_c0_g2~~TRINITY_DN949_c0_g2_i2.p1  ORF type:complete len:510 (+),score=97.67 TRINITY_DN949_c0_g2_i2:168-1697(+)
MRRPLAPCLALATLAATPVMARKQLKIGEVYSIKAGDWVAVHRDLDGPQPFPPPTDSWSTAEATLWVGIASYRDPRCGKTLHNMFTKAKHPERVHVAVVQQMVEGDADCLDDYCTLAGKDANGECPFAKNVRVLRTDASEAAGPTWGRHLQQYLLRDEEFCLQIDSHMDMIQDWEAGLMAEWAQINNDHAILSTYVQSVKDLGKSINGHMETSHLCEVIWNKHVRNQAAKALRLMRQPKLTTTWAAGLSFSKCHSMRAVPYDPYLPQVFDGEEFSYFARLFTNGYDVYTPTKTYIGHDYNGANNPNAHGWYVATGRDRAAEEKMSDMRLWTLLEMPGGDSTPEGRQAVQFGPFGLGTARTLDQLMDFAMIDLRTKTHKADPSDMCQDVHYVPCVGTPPEESGYPDRMADAPFWDYVRSALIAQGDWSPRDEVTMLQLLGRPLPQAQAQARGIVHAELGTWWWFGFVALVAATVAAAKLVVMEANAAATGAKSAFGGLLPYVFRRGAKHV